MLGAWARQRERLPLAIDVEHGSDTGGLQRSEAPDEVGVRRRHEKAAGSEVHDRGHADRGVAAAQGIAGIVAALSGAGLWSGAFASGSLFALLAAGAWLLVNADQRAQVKTP